MHCSRLALLALSCIFLSVGNAAAETAVERGRYLVNAVMACGNCHTPKDAQGRPVADMELAGGTTFDTPAFTVMASNLTPDRETGLGDWSEAAIKRAIIEGVRPENGRLPGTSIAAVMLPNLYKVMTPGDLGAVVSYLRALPPRHNEISLPIYKKPVVRSAYPDGQGSYSDASLSDPVTRGRYLATLGLCTECHSTFANGVTDYVGGLGKGGRAFRNGVVASNITSDREDGIGAWSDDEIRRAIAKGVSRDGHQLKPPMPYSWYAGMTDTDLDAIVAWLRTVPASRAITQATGGEASNR